MSKEKVLDFLATAAKDEQLKAQLQATTSQDDLVEIGNQAGYDFSSEHVDEAFTELKQKKGFFKALVESILLVFSPSHDDYPASGVQPFTDDPYPKS